MRRKQDTLLPIEVSILQAALALAKGRNREFHGYQIAKEIKEEQGARMLTAHGTLYKALDRLERGGLIESRWEDPFIAAREHRPLRRLYQVTGEGVRALTAIPVCCPHGAVTAARTPARA
jgi:DNA-binding PadR family transcriptional regulator